MTQYNTLRRPELTHAQRARYYRDTAAQLRSGGWAQRTLYSGSSSCLVGAINLATHHKMSISMDLQRELAQEIYDHSPLVQVSTKLRGEQVFATSGDGGVKIVERWNDYRFRTMTTVLRRLDTLAEKHEKLAEAERVAQLENKVKHLKRSMKKLKTQIEQLEEENRKLRAENSILKKRKARITAAQLVASSNEMAELDKQLDATAAKLEKVTAK